MKLFGNSGFGSRHARTEYTEPLHTDIHAEAEPEAAAAAEAAQAHPFWTKGRRTLAIILGVILLLAIAIVTALSIWAKPPAVSDGKNYADSTDSTPTPTPTQTPDSSEDPESTPTPTPTPNDEPDNARKQGYYTFVIAGTDQVSGSTDTLIVGSFDTVNHRINAVSIPRDTLVNVRWSVKKVNTYYSTGGAEGLMGGMTDLLGFEPDFYGVVRLQAFSQMVDAVGGVYFTVPVNMNYDDPTQNLHIHVSAGYQLLNGEQAVGVMRCRNCYSNADIGRIATQQAFLTTAAKQFLSLGNIPNLSKLVSIFTENTETDLTSGNLLWLANEFLKTDMEDITFSTMPGNTGDSIRGGSYVTIYLDEWLDCINRLLNPYTTDITEENLNILTRSGSGFYATTGTIAGGEGSFYDYTAIPVDASDPAPDVSADPVPDASTDPAPDGSIDPAPDGSADPAPDGSGDPAPDAAVVPEE